MRMKMFLAATAFSFAIVSPAMAVTVVAPGYGETFRFHFDSTIGPVSIFQPFSSVPVLAPGPGLLIQAVAPTELFKLQVYSIGDADYTLSVNGVAVPWSAIEHDLYTYFNVDNYPLSAGDNVVELFQTDGFGVDSTISLVGEGGIIATPVPASAALLIGALAGMAGFRRGARR